MRAHGPVDTAGGLGLSDHVCWVFGSDRDVREFRAAAVRFASDGVALGQRLMYVADRDEGDILADLSPIGDLAALARRDGLVVRRLRDVYPGDGPVLDANAQLGIYASAMEQAIADGFRGVRAVAEVTGLVADPAWLDGHVAWEQVADRYMATPNPLSAMCGYDRRVLGEEGAAALACVHPTRHDTVATFSLFAAAGDEVRLDGEIDAFQAPLLERALATMPERDLTILDVAGTTFLDAAGAGALARHAEHLGTRGHEIRVRHARPLVRRVWDLLGFSDIGSLRFQ